MPVATAERIGIAVSGEWGGKQERQGTRPLFDTELCSRICCLKLCMYYAETNEV